MKKSTLILAISFYSLPALSQLISGKVLDAQSGDFLEGATILVENIKSTSTDHKGHFAINDLRPGSYKLIVSHVGYHSIIDHISIADENPVKKSFALVPNTVSAGEIVVTVSKKPETIYKAPAAVYLINQEMLARFAGSNVNELVSQVPGIEYTRAGVDQINFNTRGFNSAFNNKVMQLVDGRINMAALSGSLPLFNNGSISKDDIERIEIVVGPQSALYGPNAHNAVFNYITKDPRKFEGTSLSGTIGNQSQVSTRLRSAVKVNDRLAYKFSFEYSGGREFKFYDSVYAGGGVYGPPVSIPERNVDFNYKHIRGEAGFYYRIYRKTDLILTTGASNNDFLQVTTAGRNQMRDVSNSYLQVRLVHPDYFATVYNTWGNLGSSYVIASYTRDFWDRTNSTLPRTDPVRGRLTEIEAEGFAKRPGNRFKEDSRRLNSEFQYNKKIERHALYLTAGLSFQRDDPNGFGINLVDEQQKIQVTQYGTVLLAEKKLPGAFRVTGASRWDHHSVFGNFFSPRFALIKDFKNGSLRIGYGKAYAMPSILSQFAKISNFLFGNGTGISYIPNGTRFENEKTETKTTRALLPEEVRAWESGYKARHGRLIVDISSYVSLSKNFQSPIQMVTGRALRLGNIPVKHNPAFAGSIINDTLRNAFFTTFFNYGDVRAYGLDLGVGFKISELITVHATYSFFDSDIRKGSMSNDANADGYLSKEEKSLNAPRNKGSVAVKLSNLHKNKIALDMSARFVESYDFYSGNQIGTSSGKGKRGVVLRGNLPPLYKNFDWGALGGFISFGISGAYQANENFNINIGVTNLFNSRQIEFVGSPSIGRLVSVEFKWQIPGKTALTK